MKKGTLGWLILALLAIFCVLGYASLSEPRKRFVAQLARQAPYLVPRYFV